MRGLWARLAAVGLALFSALVLASLGASDATADSRVEGYSAQVGSLTVQVYSQMCDRDGPNLNTRLNVKNNSSSPKQILVHDSFATPVYDPAGPIAPGKGMRVHLRSSRLTPARTVTLASDGQSKTLTVPESPCPPVTTSSTKKPPHSTSTTKSTTSTTKSPSSSTIVTTPVTPIDPSGGNGSPPVAGAGVVAAGGSSVGSTGAVRAASTGTLPFTGSDIRAYALIGNLLVLIGFAMLYLSHRSPRAAALLARLRPDRAAS